MTIEPTTDETLWERRYRSLQLRNARLTFDQIAQRTGVSPATARKDVEAAKRAVVEESTREQLIGEHRSVLMAMRAAQYPSMLGGDVDAAKVIMSTLVREADMFGLDAPKRTAIGVGTDVEFATTLLQLIESVGGDVPKELADVARSERDARTIDVETVELEAPAAAAGGVASEGSDGEPTPLTSTNGSNERPEGPSSEPWSNL